MGRLGDYEVESLLGMGSTGVVFRATDCQLDRQVALKVLRPVLGEAAKERFLAEARSVASLDHPNIVTIYQVGVVNDLAYIAMKWVPGETLEERFSKVAFLPEDEILEMAHQIGSGLMAAHSRNLIHRDIKPANIWLGEKNSVTILDFGLARIADDDPQMTTTGMLAGTPNFMSPEQSKGLELDGRSDLFGLGCLLYRAATGKLPFGANGILATLQAIQNEHPAPPKTLNPHLTDEFSDLIMCLLEKQPANRPSSVAEFVEAIKQPKNKWSFVPTHHTESAAEKPSSTAPHSKAKSSWTMWTALAVLFVFLSAGMFFFGPDVVRIATNQGELIIQTEDEAIKIEVLSNGKVVRIIDTKTDQSINIKSGVYQFQVANSKNGFKVSPNELEMTRGGKKVLSILSVENNASDQNETKDSFGTIADKDTYDGHTFDEWARLMKTEKNREKIRSGLLALGELSSDNPELQSKAIDVVRPLVRKHGHIVLGGDKLELVDSINQFFGFMSSDKILEFVLEECKSGTLHSRRQIAWLVMPESIFQYKPDLTKKHRELIHDHFEELVKASMDLMSEQDPQTFETGESLMSSMLRTTNGHNGFLGGQLNNRLDDQYTKILKLQMQRSKNEMIKTRIASWLIQYQKADQASVQQLAKALSSESMSGKIGFLAYSNTLPHVPKELAQPLIKPLIELFKDEERCARVSAYVANKSFGQMSVEAFRHSVIKQLGSFGYAAKSALPFLDEFSTTENFFTPAAITRQKIRKDINAQTESPEGGVRN